VHKLARNFIFSFISNFGHKVYETQTLVAERV